MPSTAPSDALLAYFADLPAPPSVAPAAAPAVQNTAELRRIRDMPWADWRTADLPALVTALSAHLRAPGGQQELKPIQAAALREIVERGSCVIPLRTGGGKTLITFLAPEVVDAKRPLLIVPAKMINSGKTHREHAAACRHWRLRPIMSRGASKARLLHAHDARMPLRVVSYEALGRLDYAEALLNWRPDLILLDEFHKVKDLSSAVTRRLGRYVRQAGSTPPLVVPLSGSPTNRRLREYAHVLRWALRGGAPLPADFHELQAWGLALDEKVPEASRIAPGALLELAPPSDEAGEPLEVARSRYARRLRSTPGIIASGDDLPGVALTAKTARLTPDAQQLEVVEHLHSKWETPCGHPFEQATELWAHEREVSAGFYYRWRVQPPPEWLAARRAWAQFVRETLAHSRSLDSPMAVANAVDRGRLADAGTLDRWRRASPLFKPHEHQEPVWVSDQTLDFCARWLERERGICWVYHVAFGEKLAAVTGIPYFSAGGRAGRLAIDMHQGPAIASIKAVNEGFNLQALHRDNLIATCPTTNRENEQLISRTHRDGQEADEVTLLYLQTLEGDAKALDQARADAVYVESTTGQPQRLCAATWIDE